ncbi:protein ROOT HAIR SPECIFIC 17-like [Salvia hispanica]|uniref:protein ROOT HAIR SPECIFIC 17-like n=1 Tax=Salvia hispanica TaxID=49212 RepID=UPI002008F994|nr:protein ROOT HAIR SPECIFIC 17-like [Salvia hispanica]
MMNKKRHRNNLIGLHIFNNLIIRRRRQRSLHSFLPLLSAICGCLLLLCASLSSLRRPLNNTSINGRSLDRELRTSVLFYGCSNASSSFQTAEMKTEPNRYLLIETSGGLNQQRTGITDAVVAAYILNATLVVPKLDQHSFWKDSSNFSDIFNVDWFVSYLSKDVKIIKQTPEEAGDVRDARVPRKCDARCYQTRVLPLFNKKRAVKLTKFDYRLSNWLDQDLQKLRCRVNYHALRFADPILQMGRKLVDRMRMKSNQFVALHLRYEPDMLAFSGCYYGGGEKEMQELGALRKRWKTLHTKDPERERRQGKCLLTPEEIGLMLRALGFAEDVHLYVASGEIYGGEETLAPLKALFPNFHTKESISSKEELAQFSSYSSRLAALDFFVCDESDVFVANNNGNMAKILAGRRRYFGHKPTIRPNAKRLHELFLNRDKMGWGEFSSRVLDVQVGFMGEPSEAEVGRGSFHENPYSCICRSSEVEGNGGLFVGEVSDEAFSEDDQDLALTQYADDGNESMLQ